MRIIDNNKIEVGEQIISFDSMIDTVLHFDKYFVVMLMDDIIPDNNVMAFDYKGNKVWDISDIIKLSYLEAYVSACEATSTSFYITSYNGVTYLIDTINNNVVNKSISK